MHAQLNPGRFGIALGLVALSVGYLTAELRAQDGPPIRSSFYDGTATSVATFPWQPQFNSTVEMTVEAWVYREEANAVRLYPILSQEGSFALYFWGEFLAFNRGQEGTIAAATIQVPVHQWTHVAASYDGERVRFYVDGEAAGDFALANDGVGANFRLLVGGMGSFVFKGWLDEVRLWSAALTQAQIRENLYREPRTRPTLKAVWAEGGAREALAGLTAFGSNRPREDVFGILPRDLVIPESPVVPQTDGIVDLSTEYRGAEQLVIRYKEGGRVRDAVAYLVYRRTGFLDHWTLHVGIPAPSDTTGGRSRDLSWLGLLFDADNSKHAVAQREDFEVGAYLGAANSFYRVGTGGGGYVTPSEVPPNWQWKTAKYFGSGDLDPPSIEFEIFGIELLGSLTETDGLAVGHHGISRSDDRRLGPSDAVFNSPATWANVTYGGAAAALPKASIWVRILDANTGEEIRDNLVYLRDATNNRVLATRAITTTAEGAGLQWYQFNEVPVPEGAPLEVVIDPCTSCLYEELPRVFEGTGVAPTELRPASVLLPPCAPPSCIYRSLEFQVQRPLPPIVATSFSPESGNPRIVLRNDPLKVIEPTEITITGENFHRQMTVYVFDCLEVPPLSDCVEGEDYFALPIKEGSLSASSVTVALPEIPGVVETFLSKPYRFVIRDNWARPGITPGTASQWVWVSSGDPFIVRAPLYPQIHGFEFRNAGESGNRRQYTAIFGDSVFFRPNGCAWRPMYAVYFPIFLLLVKDSGGSCVGMASTSQMFAEGRLDPSEFGAFYADGLMGGAWVNRCPWLDGEEVVNVWPTGPPRPAEYHRGRRCGPWRPDNLWARIRRNHGAQFSHQVLSEMLRQIPGHRVKDGDPVAVLGRIRENPTRYALSMLRDGGGHTVTPFEIIDGKRYEWRTEEQCSAKTDGELVDDPDSTVIRIYDNNTPGWTERYVTINRVENRYYYRWMNDRGKFKYEGKRLYALPLELWESNLTRIAIAGDGVRWLWHFIMGDADGLHEAADGRRWGWDAEGNYIDEYPGGIDIPAIHGDDTQELRTHQFFTSPEDAPARSTINVRGQDYYFHADQGDTILQLHVMDGREGDQDRVQVQTRDDRLCTFEFIPASARANFTPTIAIEFSDTESASYAWTGLAVNKGESVGFETMPDARAVKCINKSGRPARYTLTVNSADETVGLALVQDFGPFDLPPGAAHVVALATWPELDAVRSELDLDGDGRTDRTELVLATPQPVPPTHFKDVPYRPEGNALVQDTNQGQLIVDGLADEEGTDGVTFHLAGAQSVNLSFGAIAEAAQTPDGAFQAAFLYGPSQGLLVVLESVDLGKEFQHTIDFGAIGSATATLRIFNGAELALELRGHSGSMLAPAGLGASLAEVIMPDGRLSVNQTWPEAMILTPEGSNPVKGDRVVWISESLQRRLTANELHTLTLTGYQAPAYVVTDLRLDRVVAPVLRFTRLGDSLELSWEPHDGYVLMVTKDLIRWEPVSEALLGPDASSFQVKVLQNQAEFYQLRLTP